MSKLTEYIKLLPRIINNIDTVIEGFINDVKLEHGMLPQHEQEVIAGRRLICSECPYNSKKAKELGLYTTERTDYHCSFCGCLISKKTAALDANCGIEAYNDKNPNTPMKLKWEKIK